VSTMTREASLKAHRAFKEASALEAEAYKITFQRKQECLLNKYETAWGCFKKTMTLELGHQAARQLWDEEGCQEDIPEQWGLGRCSPVGLELTVGLRTNGVGSSWLVYEIRLRYRTQHDDPQKRFKAEHWHCSEFKGDRCNPPAPKGFVRGRSN